MRSLVVHVIVMLLTLSLAAAPCLSADKNKKCMQITGTGDGLHKETALESAKLAIDDAITKWQATSHVTNYEEKAWKPDPHPFWRSSVSPDLFLTPDVVTDKVYSICWKGVVSPAVCSAGTEICWQ